MILKNKEDLFPDTDIEDKKFLIYERAELKELHPVFLSYFKGNGAPFFRVINGPSGSGKTLSIKYLFFNIFKSHPEFAKGFI